MHRRIFIKTICKASAFHSILNSKLLTIPLLSNILGGVASNEWPAVAASAHSLDEACNSKISSPKKHVLEAGLSNQEPPGIEKFEALMAQATRQKWYLMPIADIFTRVGLYFIDMPYIANTLEHQPEGVVIDFSGFDCFTFAEVSLNIARMIKGEFKTKRQKTSLNETHSSDTTLNAGLPGQGLALVAEGICYTRYRGGALDGYESRLHYASDWILDNVKKGVIKDVTKDIGAPANLAIKHKLNVWYMSKNYKQYPALANAPKSLIDKIKAVENKLNNQYCYIIPTGACTERSVTNALQDGDIIAIATSTPGLDYGHLGIMLNGRLLHASSKKKQVILDSTICDYLKSARAAFGISILRLL